MVQSRSIHTLSPKCIWRTLKLLVWVSDLKWILRLLFLLLKLLFFLNLLIFIILLLFILLLLFLFLFFLLLFLLLLLLLLIFLIFLVLFWLFLIFLLLLLLCWFTNFRFSSIDLLWFLIFLFHNRLFSLYDKAFVLRHPVIYRLSLFGSVRCYFFLLPFRASWAREGFIISWLFIFSLIAHNFFLFCFGLGLSTVRRFFGFIPLADIEKLILFLSIIFFYGFCFFLLNFFISLQIALPLNSVDYACIGNGYFFRVTTHWLLHTGFKRNKLRGSLHRFLHRVRGISQIFSHCFIYNEKIYIFWSYARS